MMHYLNIYTDGSCIGNPGPSGVGVLMKFKKKEKRISKYIGNATNNIAELTAIKIGLESALDKSIPTRVYSDSQYSINILTKGWKVNKNVELVAEIKKLANEFDDIRFIWVKGHAGHVENEIADKLANKAARNEA